MTDVVDKKTRSHIMSCIRSKNTKIEMILRRDLWKSGYRYRTHYNLPGKPDIVFPKEKLAVFVDGDFWHGYDWNNLKPKLKNDFWIEKIKRNMKRDKKVNEELKMKGWVVIRFWEHEILNNLGNCRKKIIKHIH